MSKNAHSQKPDMGAGFSSIGLALAFWPALYFAIENLRSTSLSIFETKAHAYGYLITLVMGCLVISSLLIRNTPKLSLTRLGVILILAVLLLYSLAGALFNLWVIGCYGFGEGCI